MKSRRPHKRWPVVCIWIHASRGSGQSVPKSFSQLEGMEEVGTPRSGKAWAPRLWTMIARRLVEHCRKDFALFLFWCLHTDCRPNEMLSLCLGHPILESLASHSGAPPFIEDRSLGCVGGDRSGESAEALLFVLQTEERAPDSGATASLCSRSHDTRNTVAWHADWTEGAL